jgi:hypothetical protein
LAVMSRHFSLDLCVLRRTDANEVVLERFVSRAVTRIVNILGLERFGVMLLKADGVVFLCSIAGRESRWTSNSVRVPRLGRDSQQPIPDTDDS